MVKVTGQVRVAGVAFEPLVCLLDVADNGKCLGAPPRVLQ